MNHLDARKLHVRFLAGLSETPGAERRYTLTHSDTTGELFLSIGPQYDRKQVSGLYTRLMRDEVLAEWRRTDGVPALHVHCHVSGGLVFGSAGWRAAIFRQHMPQVLQAFCHGDRAYLDAHPERKIARIYVHFHARQKRHNRVIEWGQIADFLLRGKTKITEKPA